MVIKKIQPTEPLHLITLNISHHTALNLSGPAPPPRNLQNHFSWTALLFPFSLLYGKPTRKSLLFTLASITPWMILEGKQGERMKTFSLILPSILFAAFVALGQIKLMRYIPQTRKNFFERVFHSRRVKILKLDALCRNGNCMEGLDICFLGCRCSLPTLMARLAVFTWLSNAALNRRSWTV